MDLIERLHELGVVLPGEFMGTNVPVDFYIDIKKAYGDPDILQRICDELYESMESATCIAACGYGGISPASVLSVRYNLPVVLVREREKFHGTAQKIDGYIPNEDDIVALIDDVCTTGRTLRHMINIIEHTGATIASCHVVVKRGEGDLPVPLFHVLTEEEILNI